MSTTTELRTILGSLADDVLPHLQGVIPARFHGMNEIVARKAIELVIPELACPLLDYQTIGAFAINEARRVLLGDDMGVGKTPQAIAGVLLAGTFPALFVVPSSLTLQWEREFAKFAPSLKVQRLVGETPYALDPSAQVYIIGHAVVAKWVDTFTAADLRAIVLDESQLYKNYKAARTKAVKNIARKVDADGVRALLSGTAAENDHMEILSQMDILGVLDSTFGGFESFTECYAPKADGGYGRESINGAELHAVLKDSVMVRRLATEVNRTPGMDRLPVAIEMRGEGLTRYKAAETSLRTFLAEFRKLTPEKITKSMRAERLVKMGVLRREIGLAKVPATIDYVNQLVENGEQVIVFAWHRDIVKMYAEAFGADTIMGGDSVVKVEEAKARFQAGEKRVIVLNIKAGGVGHNLTAAKHVVFGEFAWNPSAMKQAEKRADRIGQTQRVLTHWLIGSNGVETIDAKLVNIINAKGNRIGIVLDGAAEQLIDMNDIDETSIENALLADYGDAA